MLAEWLSVTMARILNPALASSDTQLDNSLASHLPLMVVSGHAFMRVVLFVLIHLS